MSSASTGPGSRGIPSRGPAVLGFALLAALVAVVVIAFARETVRPDLPDQGPAPAFELTDQDGRAFSSRSLEGKVYAAHFMFSRCENTCPAQMAKLLLVEKAVSAAPELHGKVRLLSFSVDAERDRPEDLKAYAERRGADPSLSVFLTGNAGEVARLSVEGFKFAASAAPAGPEGGAPAITHSDRLVLVDAAGRIRGHYQPTVEDRDLERLIRDVKWLAVQVRS